MVEVSVAIATYMRMRLMSGMKSPVFTDSPYEPRDSVFPAGDLS
jgi:hypothetical protein